MATHIIAEIGSVHDGSIGNAEKLIEAAAAAGADIVKFQTHLAEAETLVDAPAPAYFKGEPRFEYFKRTGFSESQWKRLAQHAANCGVQFLSSPFSEEAVDLLERVGATMYKVPSGEVSNLPLLEHLAHIGKPVLLSSGMSNWSELDAAVEALKGRVELTVLQCTSMYPCTPERVGLNVLAEMRNRYGVNIGYSDHTPGYAAPIAAAALGANVIEKHFTFSKLMYGSDAKNSMEPAEFTILCKALREVWTMIASPVDKNDVSPYLEMKRIFEKSIVTARSLPAGSILNREMLAFKKPGDGIPASRYRELIGRTVRRALPENHKLLEDDVF
jgi:N,N'-diacetyllegionaminate synthase